MNLYNKDCLDYLKSIEDNSIDCIVTDPPYGINYAEWDKFEDYEKFLTEFLIECYRVLKPNHHMWMFFGCQEYKKVFSAVETSGFDNNLENWSIYARNKGRGSKYKFKSLREDILHLSKGKYKPFNYIEYLRDVIAPFVKDGKPRGWFIDQTTGKPVRFTGVGNVLTFAPASFNSKMEPQFHIAQKPLLLNMMLIMASTNKGETVLDPFMGSGSSGVACQLCDRDYIGIEKDKDMFEKAKHWNENINWAEKDNYISRVRSNNMSLFSSEETDERK